MTAAGLAAVAVLAVAPGQASAVSPKANSEGAHIIAAEARADGSKGAPVKVSAAQLSADRAKMICSGHAEEYGNWVNADPSTAGIARIELRDCQSVVVCNGDICTIYHDAGWATHVFGKCSPTNCDWGWSKAEFRLSSGHIYGYYDQGFAKRYVYAKMSQTYPGRLWVYWRTDFVDPNRQDYEKQEWFDRA
jgi:hypothetical protein